MNILVVNDDGVKSPGIYSLVQALAEKADVYVCAPDGQRSAKSHAITLGEKVYVTPISFPGAKEAYQTSGTPADCTKIGLQFFEEAGIKIDAVFSGINLGSNLGRDTLYSGTVGAASEAALDGIRAVAVSVASHDASEFEMACDLAVKSLEYIFDLPRGIVVNINTPNLPVSEIKGVKITHLGPRYYDDRFHQGEGEGYELSGQPAERAPGEVNDSVLIHDGYATITPLQFDFTCWDLLKEMEGYC